MQIFYEFDRENQRKFLKNHFTHILLKLRLKYRDLFIVLKKCYDQFVKKICNFGNYSSE
jgi:hypothetical protein